MATEIWNELATTREGFLQALSLFNQDNFNKVPFKGSWTAGQVAEHVLKSVDGVPHLLTGASQPTQRDPALHVPNLRAMFLDYETKMKSPPSILPSDEPKDQDTLIKALGDKLTAVIEAAQTIDLAPTISNFEFPGSGPLTRLELVNFMSVHTQRHAHQLKEIRKHF